MSQITIRHIDPRLESQIRQMAGQQHISLSEAAKRLLMKGAGLGEDVAKKRDLLDLAGTWSQVQADAFEKTQERFYQIDPELWQ